MNANVLKSEQPSAATVKSATRVLEIFEYFDEVRRPVTIQDVAQALSYPHSSTAALLKSLVSLGYLEHDDRGKTFFPSIRISLLGNWVEAEALPIRNVQRLMRRLSADTGCTIILAARLGAYAQYVKVIQGTSPIRFHVKPSTKRMLAFSTIGRVLLSELPLPEARRLIHDALAAMPERRESMQEIEDELQRIRKRGLALYSDLVTPGATMLAMPIPMGPSGRSVAIGIAAPNEYFRNRKLPFTALLKNAIAEHISQNGQGFKETVDDEDQLEIDDDTAP
ncbi:MULTISPECIES: helix-turn-helix domain-containing protein [Alphaproteobacteria]|jgi:DNA-binding IclR family transcriptional regulator|uniref:IclR family transcriptional regulator n=1 Tax=Alphaproteobacteria TaxID=28211 RepID=UPI000C93249F|nr:helix-turn-helix domain-containing protein [Parvibaculum sp.]MAB12391.1 IclR family transcriptional regulator [Parvibaculum sp.]|tara:strand:- start:340 stop:1179 length:840 start_codon:yes stop_codon:yes gene_type:complete